MKKADYEIVAALVVDDRTPNTIRPIRVELDAVERQAKQTGRSISTYLKGALAAVGGIAAIGGLSKGIVGLHSEIQTAEAGLATLLSANYGVDAAEGLRLARHEVAELRKAAAAGSGELGHYLEGLQVMLGPGLALGATTEELRELTQNALTAGEVLRGQEGLSLATFDVMQALSGQVGDRTTPIVMQALQAAGISAEAFRQLKGKERIDALNEGFRSFSEGAKLMAQTWDNQMAAFRDSVKEVVRTATTPLFEAWLSKLRDANDWLRRNEDRLQVMAEVWGERLLGTWDHLIRNARTYAAILGAVAVLEAAPGGGAVQQRLGSLAHAGGFIGPMGRRGLPMRDLFSRGGATAVARGLWAGIAGALPKVMKGTAVLAVLAAAIDGVMGAWREFPAVAGFVAGAAGQVTDAFAKLVESLGSWNRSGSILNWLGAALLGVAGAGLHLAGVVVRLGATLFRVGGFILEFIGRLGEALFALMTGNFSAIRHGGMLFGAYDSAFEDLKAIWTGPQDPRRKAADDAAEAAEPRGDGVGGQVTNVFVNEVRVETEMNADPARIYRAFEEIADKTRRYAIAARRNPAFG